MKLDTHHKLAYQCECRACGVDPGALCQRITTRTTMQLGRVHAERLDDALALHRRRHPAASHPNDDVNPGVYPDGWTTFDVDGPTCPRCGQTSLMFGVICDHCRAEDRAAQGTQLGFSLGVPTITTGQATL